MHKLLVIYVPESSREHQRTVENSRESQRIAETKGDKQGQEGDKGRQTETRGRPEPDKRETLD